MIVVDSSVWIDFLTRCASWPDSRGWVLAMHPCRNGILHAFAARSNITKGRSKALSSERTSRAPPARRTLVFKLSAARVPEVLRLDGSRLRDGPGIGRPAVRPRGSDLTLGAQAPDRSIH
jgi:hypothetical protein